MHFLLLLGPVLKDSRVLVTTVVVYLSIFLLLLFFISNEKNKSVFPSNTCVGKDPAAVHRKLFSHFVSELLLWSKVVFSALIQDVKLGFCLFWVLHLKGFCFHMHATEEESCEIFFKAAFSFYFLFFPEKCMLKKSYSDAKKHEFEQVLSVLNRRDDSCLKCF